MCIPSRGTRAADRQRHCDAAPARRILSRDTRAAHPGLIDNAAAAPTPSIPGMGGWVGVGVGRR